MNGETTSCESQGMMALKSSNNGSICSCNPGFFFQTISENWGLCISFLERFGLPNSMSNVEPSKNPRILSISGAPNTFIWTTLTIVGLWLLATVALLLWAPTSGFWFRVRCALAAWDKRYSLRHWVNDQKCLLKRSTELGGIMSVASWILFVGLASSLVYQAISFDTVNIQDLTPAKSDDIQMFRNDIEINVTTVGQLQCSQVVQSRFSVSGSNGYIWNASVKDFQKPVCLDTSKGPLVRILCKHCLIKSDRYLFTWEFEDEVNAKLIASAVGFEINASATASMRHTNLLTAILPAGYNGTSPLPATLRGSDWNVISLNFVPRVFRSEGDLKLVQIMFHMFTSGSYVVDIKEMQNAFAKEQGVRVALQVNVLSQYLVETTYRSYFGIVKFLAYLGGLYVFSRFLFLIILIQCEITFPKLLHQEKLLNRLVAKERAKTHWAKVRIYVKHTKVLNSGKYDVHKKSKPHLKSRRDFARSDEEPRQLSSKIWQIVKQKFTAFFSTWSKRSKSEHTRKEVFEKSGQSPTEVISESRNHNDQKTVCSLFFVRQYRKPAWIHEMVALPPVPEPPSFIGQLSDEGARSVYLDSVSDYVQKMNLYSMRLRRDFLATLAVLEKVAWYFGLHKN